MHYDPASLEICKRKIRAQIDSLKEEIARPRFVDAYTHHTKKLKREAIKRLIKQLHRLERGEAY